MKRLLVAAVVALAPSLANAQALSSNYVTSAIVPGQTASEHAAGDAIGGWQTISFFRSASYPTGLLSALTVASTGGSTQPVSFFIYSKDVTGTTTCSDNNPFSEAAADVAFRAVAPFTVTPAATVGSTRTGATYPLAASIVNQDSVATANLYVCMVAAAPITPASTTDISFKLSGIRD